jgi:hypothetical protein
VSLSTIGPVSSIRTRVASRTFCSCLRALPVSGSPSTLPLSPGEDVHHEYSAIGPTYWLGVLGTALDQYGELHSPEPTFRTNPDELLAGEEIVKAHAQGTLGYQSTGRNGGKGGNLLSDDIVGGGWREQSYEVRRDPDPINHNWFVISEFIAKTSKS